MVSLRLRKKKTPERGGARGTAKRPRVPARVRVQQLRQAFTATRKADPRMPLLVAAAMLGPFLVALAVGLVFGMLWFWIPIGIMLGLLGGITVFGKRVQRTAFSQVEGQLGAAAAVLSNMRGDWRVTPAVGFSREQDLVHRVVGKPGIVLVAEGSPARTRGLLVNEKRRLARFVGQTPVYDLTVGDGEGQVPLQKLERHVIKLPHNIKPKDVNILDRKLKAMAPALPIPKGPVPGRVPRGKMR